MSDMTRPKTFCSVATLGVVMIINLCYVRADYELEVRAHSYSNPSGTGSNGNCCESVTSPPCFLDCDTSFTFCLRSFGASRDGDRTNCPLGRFQTSDDIGDNNIVFGVPFIESPGVPNPMVFTGATWPGGFQLYVEVEDDDGSFLDPDHIDDIYIEQTLVSGQTITQRNYRGFFRVATISLSFTLTCTRLFGPNCASICEPLNNPPNGRVSQPGTNVEGSIATYSCDVNYVLSLEGTPTRTCQISGEWTGTAPSCIFDCGPPPAASANGQVQVTSTIVDSDAVYSCNEGYILTGPPPSPQRITCLPSGWSGPAPMCVLDCPALPEPDNGQINYSPFPSTMATRATASYSCDLGHTLVEGDTILSCVSGQWSGTPPICEPGCGSLVSPTNGRVFHSNTTVGSMATYTCNDGFGLVGAMTRTCTLTGWAGSVSSCDFDCGPLTDPINGRVQLTGTTLQNTAMYSCNIGYGIVGISRQTCLSSGWSNIPPICAVDCGELLSPNNGRVSDPSTVEGSQATYSCFSGFDLVGDPTRECQSTGIWSGEAPICQRGDDDPQTGNNLGSTIGGAVAGGVVATIFVVVVVVGCVIWVCAGCPCDCKSSSSDCSGDCCKNCSSDGCCNDCSCNDCDCKCDCI